jgi:hypothetical protein|nr:MAG TPA: hypothetical protein [Caudoviricetes sp.]
MANYNNLKTSISKVIKTNGNEEITGVLLRQTLLAMINVLGAGYQFVGIAQPDTLSGAVDYRCFYIAAKAGTYTDFNNIEVEDGELVLLVWDTDWTKRSIVLGVADGAVSIDKLNTDLQSKVNDNVKFVEQNLTKEQQLQARKNIELPDYETFDDLRKLSTLTAKRLLYVGIDTVYPGFPISVNSSTEEIDFQGKKIYFRALDAEQIAFKGHPNCKLKNLSCVLLTANYTKDANVCISKFGYVENVTVDCPVYSSEVGKEVNKTIGFLSCDHLYNCRVIGGGVMGKRGITKGYSYCNYLNLCRYKIDGELVGAKGFDHCQFISQCYVNRQSEEVMGLGTNSNVESFIWILADGSFETFSDIDHITVGGYDTTNMFKTIGSVGGTGKTKLYAKPDDKSGMATVLLDTAPVNSAVARRTPTGTLKAKDAVEDDDTVTKKQLNALKTEVTQHLTEDEVANLWDTTTY